MLTAFLADLYIKYSDTWFGPAIRSFLGIISIFGGNRNQPMYGCPSSKRVEKLNLKRTK